MNTKPGLPPHVSARLSLLSPSEPKSVYIGATVVGDWIVVDEAFGPPDQSMLASLAGETQIITAIGDMTKAQPAAPAGSGGPPPLVIRPVSPPVSPVSDDVAAARQSGDRILQSSHAEALFENVTDSKMIDLRHRASGLDCVFMPNGSGAIVQGPRIGVTDRADAITCAGRVGSFDNVLTILPNTGRLSFAQAFAQALTRTRSETPDLTPFAGPRVAVNATFPLPRHAALSLVGTSGFRSPIHLPIGRGRRRLDCRRPA
jgi:hypothetical protein